MIVNVNSGFGHHVPMILDDQKFNVYPGTKHAVTAISEVMRQELSIVKNDKIRVTVS